MQQNPNFLSYPLQPTYLVNPIPPVHPIHGNIKCLLAICWITLFAQISLLSTFIIRNYISYLEFIFDIILTLSLNLIAVLLSIANNLNSKKIFTFFKFSFILSIVNFGVSILSIIVVLCAFNNKLRGFLKTSPYVEAFYDIEKYLIGGSIITTRLIEFLPFLIFLCYRKPILNRPKGTINKQLKGMTDENFYPLLKNENANVINKV